GERHDLAKVRVVAPEGTMERLLARNPGEQRNVDTITDKPNIGVMSAYRQQRERGLHHFRRASTIDDRIELVLPSGLLQFLPDVTEGFALDADDMVGAIILCTGELVGIAGERDDGRPCPQQLGILTCESPEPPDTEHADPPIGPEPAGIADLLDAAIRREPCIRKRRELLEFQMLRDLDHITGRNRNIFREPAISAEARPAHVGADVRVAHLAVAPPA